MITRKTVQILSKKYQTLEMNIIREYFQHLFLAYLYKHKEAAKISFKGGTALRIVYQSPRFSEDLDFSSDIKNVSRLEALIIATLSEMERENAGSEIIEAKKTSGGYLSIIDFSFENRKISIRLEISFRKKTSTKGETVVIAGDFIPAFTIVQLSEKQLVAEKIQALLDRQKPRDFFDLYFMLRANLIPAHEKHFLPKALDVLNKTKISFSKELKIFLPKSHWPIVHDFRKSLEREIRRFL